ncbi:MAG: hypothetical protein SCH68_11915 [Brevefilum sp.]|nr:hypothetical protein [Brevefilum sp.]
MNDYFDDIPPIPVPNPKHTEEDPTAQGAESEWVSEPGESAVQPESKAIPQGEEVSIEPESEAIPEAGEYPDQPEVEESPAEETAHTPPEPEPIQVEKAQKSPPSRFLRVLRKILIGLVIAALIFLAGFLTDHFVRFKPLSDTLNETQAELEGANEAISDLETQNTQLTSANRTANNEISSLETELASVKANALYYQVLVDVNTARIELFLENIEGAQTALADTQENLEALLPNIIEVDPELGLSLPRRLELIISGITRDPETGLIDLELFTKDLLELEPLLVGE